MSISIVELWFLRWYGRKVDFFPLECWNNFFQNSKSKYHLLKISPLLTFIEKPFIFHHNKNNLYELFWTNSKILSRKFLSFNKKLNCLPEKVRRRRDMNSATFFAFKVPSKSKAIFICGTHGFRNLHIAKITMIFGSKSITLKSKL